MTADSQILPGDVHALGIPLFDSRSLLEVTLARIRFAAELAADRGVGVEVACSFGKDSVVLLDLVKRSGITFKAIYNVTSVDPPELMRFGRKNFPEVEWRRPPMTMFQLIVLKGYPTRARRSCCRILKERAQNNVLTLTGVRWAESANRRKGGMIRACQNRGHIVVNPMIDWTTEQVWRYTRERGLPVCELYAEGWTRIGCVLCPFGDQKRDAARWPLVAAAYRRAFGRLWETRHTSPRVQKYGATWRSADALFDWWISGRGFKREPEGQCYMFGAPGMAGAK